MSVVILVPPPQHNPVIHTTSPTRDADVTDPLCRAEYYRRFSRTPTTFHRSVFILCSQTMCTVTTILFPSTSPFPNPKFLSLVTQPGKADGYKESSEEARREHATDAETIGATNDGPS